LCDIDQSVISIKIQAEIKINHLIKQVEDFHTDLVKKSKHISMIGKI
jgi:hypothetical protein